MMLGHVLDAARARLWPWTIAAAALAGLVAGAQAAAPADDPVTQQAARLFWWGDMEALTAYYDEIRKAHRHDARGNLEIEALRAGLGRVFRGDDSDAVAYYAEVVRLTEQHAASHPASPLAYALVARARYALAWAVRGNAYNDKTPPQALAAFAKEIAAAQRVLEDHADVAMTDPTSHVYLLMIGRSAGWSYEKQWAVLQDALRRDPDDIGVYSEMILSLLPKWGGNPDLLDAVVQDAVGRTRPTLGTAMYASLYWYAFGDYKAGLFRDTRARWDVMKQSFDELIARYPDPSYLNRYALVACVAGDRPTTARLLREIGDAPVIAEWNVLDGRKTFDGCRRWLREEGSKGSETATRGEPPPGLGT